MNKKTKLKNFVVNYIDKKEFHVLKKEIFSEGIYDIDIPKSNPVIIDIGAHIGLSVLYFKEIYPQSTIFAFEPHPVNFSLLEMNIFENNLKNVICFQKAIHSEKGKRNLYYQEGNLSTSSFLKNAWDHTETNQSVVSVEGVLLNEFINYKVDLLKIDIEGLEYDVLLGAKKALSQISNIVFELHYSNRKSFDRISRFLESSGFEIDIPKKLEVGRMYIIKCFKNKI